jgi:hypothetical protein
LEGFSLPVIGKILNHSSQHVTAVYARLQMEDTRIALDRIGAVFEQSWSK